MNAEHGKPYSFIKGECMYIAPNSTVKVLRNVPLDAGYEQTIYFASATDQANYFASKAKYTFDLQTYQRVHKGRMRLKMLADNMYDCNYLMFKNTSFGDKWFYAFIKNVEYVNNEVSEIEYEIDVIQTWLRETNFEMCFVERMHTRTDNIGDNIQPEPVEVGEYVFNNYGAITSLSNMCVIVAIVDTSDSSIGVDGKLYDGIYGGATLYAFNSTDATGINNLLDSYLQAPDSIISIYMAPIALIGGQIPSNHLLPTQSHGVGININNIAALTGSETINGYTPKNKKLYTYPYNFYHVDNASGQSLELRYEFFSGLKPCMLIDTNITQPVQLIARPYNYKGYNSTELTGPLTLNSESIELSNLPLCSWNVDAYKAWTAQNSLPIFTNFLSGIGRAVTIGTVMENPVGGAISGVNTIINNFNTYYKASIAADIIKGNIKSGNVNVANYKFGFYGGRCSVTYDYARVIDSFFTRYGYAIRQTITPIRNNRSKWTYIKTVDCEIRGNIPADDKVQICNIHDKGITYWVYSANIDNEIGDFSLTNSTL